MELTIKTNIELTDMNKVKKVFDLFHPLNNLSVDKEVNLKVTVDGEQKDLSFEELMEIVE